jgi:Na+/H+-dicarboxylate symporter
MFTGLYFTEYNREFSLAFSSSSSYSTVASIMPKFDPKLQ